MKVYEFAYSECIHESGCVTQSIHLTRKGAETAMDFHKKQMYEEWLAIWPDEEERKNRTFGNMEMWIIKETEVQD